MGNSMMNATGILPGFSKEFCRDSTRIPKVSEREFYRDFNGILKGFQKDSMGTSTGFYRDSKAIL